MKIISCFDGCAGAMQALKSLGIKVDEYYAFEIDKYAAQIAAANHPEIAHLGSIEDWKSWFYSGNITTNMDLIVGGSPCQDLSIAGKRKGLAGERSGLFYIMADMIKQLKPKCFLVENVASMKSCQRDIISEELGVEPIMINSALVTAQNRKRLYWTNIPGVEQPDDRGILLKDIIDGGVVTKDKSYCVTASMMSGLDSRDTSQKGGKRQIVFVGGLESGRRLDDGKNLSRNFRDGSRIYSDEGKSSTLTGQPKGGPGGYTGLYEIRDRSQKTPLNKMGCIEIGHAVNIKGKDILKRVYSQEGKCPTLTAICGGNQEKKIAIDEVYYRKLTPLECERLQGFSDDYTKGVSNTQRYKMIGNGFTVPVIAHILKRL